MIKSLKIIIKDSKNCHLDLSCVRSKFMESIEETMKYFQFVFLMKYFQEVYDYYEPGPQLGPRTATVLTR